MPIGKYGRLGSNGSDIAQGFWLGGTAGRHHARFERDALRDVIDEEAALSEAKNDMPGAAEAVPH